MIAKINRIDFRKALFAALLAPTLFVFLCLNIHYANILECSDSSLLLAFYFVLAPLSWAFLLFLVQCPFFGSKLFNNINLAVFLCGWLLWIQANLFNWGFTPFNGTLVDWNVFRPFILIELFLLCILIFVIFCFRGWFSRKAVLISAIVLTGQAASFLYVMIPWISLHRSDEGEIVSWIKYDTDMSGEFTFSKNKNIILLVVDSFPGFMAQRILNDHPELAEQLKDFTFYKNCRSYPGGTTVNVPAILTGKILTENFGTTANFFAHSDYPIFIQNAFHGPLSVPQSLKACGYRVELYPEARGVVYWDDQMIDNAVLRTRQRKVWYKDGSGTNESCLDLVTTAAVFRICPTFLKKYSSGIKKYFVWNAEQTFCPFKPDTVDRCFPDRNINDPDTQFTQRINSNIAFDLRQENCFKYIHLFGVHVPHQRDAHVLDGAFYDPANKNASAELSLEWGYLRLVGQFIEKLKEQNIYDDATIIVMGDHVQHYSMVVPSALNYYPTFDSEHTFFNNPLFLVKKSKEHSGQMTVREEFIRTDDIPAFLIRSAGGKLPDNVHSFDELPQSIVAERQKEYDQLCQTSRAFLAKMMDVVKPQKQAAASRPVDESRSGRCWFLFNNSAFSELVVFGDQDRDYTRSFFLRSESSGKQEQYGFGFKAELAFRKGDYDSTYKFIKAVFDSDVWGYECLLNLAEVPDGRYRMGILETTLNSDYRRETLFDTVTVKNGKIL